MVFGGERKRRREEERRGETWTRKNLTWEMRIHSLPDVQEREEEEEEGRDLVMTVEEGWRR